jgi:DNA-binding LytR/AlgR family response regulator
MQILICDDMRQETDKLANILNGMGINPAVFNSGADALAFIRSGGAVDLCILDIVMPGMNGIQLAEELRSHGWAGDIVFLSASNDFAHQSYNVNAFHYLLKPPSRESVETLLDKLVNARKNAVSGSILLKTAGVAKNVPLRDISYIEVIRNKVCFRLTDGGEIEVYMTFKDAARELLSDNRFIQCHRSYVVNMDDIAEVCEWELFTRGKARIPVSRSFRGVREAYFTRKFGGGRK